LLGTTPATGQTQPPPDSKPQEPTRFQYGIGLLAGVPIGEFGKNVEAAGGFSGHLGVAVGDSIVSLGGEAAYLWYGHESRTVPWSLTIPDVLLTVNTDNAMFLLHGRVRAQPREGRWRPYVDGLFGFTDIFTKTSIGDLGTCAQLRGSRRRHGWLRLLAELGEARRFSALS
jgi:hypothetical protein